MILRISPSVDHLLLAKTPLITYFIILEILTLGCNSTHKCIFKTPSLVQCSFLFAHPATELEHKHIDKIYIYIFTYTVITFNNLQTCWDSKYQIPEIVPKNRSLGNYSTTFCKVFAQYFVDFLLVFLNRFARISYIFHCSGYACFARL